MALVNAGGVRDPGFVNPVAIYPYDVTYGNAFAARSAATVWSP